MHLPRLAFAAAFVFAAGGAGASGSGNVLPGDLIQSCLTELDGSARAQNDSDSRTFNLHKRCPRLAKELADIIDSRELESTSIKGLRDLRYFESGFRPRPGPKEKFAPDFDGLDALLAEVLIEEVVNDSLWDRFLRWLEQFAKDDEDAQFNRFLDWLQDLDPPPWLGDVILNTSVALILLLALMVIGNELRLSGVLRRYRRAQKLPATDTDFDAVSPAHARSIDEIRGLPPRELAAAALKIVTEAFAARDWVSPSVSLTNGELVRQVGKRQPGLGNAFGALVNAIETVIYGDRPANDEERNRLLESTARLMERAHHGSRAVTKGSG